MILILNTTWDSSKTLSMAFTRAKWINLVRNGESADTSPETVVFTRVSLKTINIMDMDG
jgi:hypothetical protein